MGEGIGWHICTLRTRKAIQISVTDISFPRAQDLALLFRVGYLQNESVYEIF